MAGKKKNIEFKLPAVALRGLTILPDMIIHFDLSRSKSIQAVEKAMLDDQRLFLVTQCDAEDKEPDFERVYHVGTVAVIKQVIKMPNNIIRVLVDGTDRAVLQGFSEEETDYLLADIKVVSVRKGKKEEVFSALEEAMARQIKELYTEFCFYHKKTGATLQQQIQEITDCRRLFSQVAINLPVDFQKKQRMLEAFSIEEQYQVLSNILQNEIEIAKVKSDLAEKIKSRVEKNQKEYVLREQMNYIREELGEEGTPSEAEQFEEALKSLKISAENREKIKKEIDRFRKLSASSSESAVERGYIETLLDLPWNKTSKDNLDMNRAETILDRDHYGLKNVKERILEFLAVRALSQKGTSPIICLVGPPGTGKTSIAKSVADALNKKYVRICLGGIHDEAEIRGHRKTYVGAMPGRIAAGMKQAGVKNPLMLLDEIDKMSRDYKGDTSAALLEVLDSEQNCHFRDHYVELPMDLSEVLFIATANNLSDIQEPLRDRMEIIEVNSYTANEKFHIAKEHLLAKQYEKNGLLKDRLSISDNALNQIILKYTREAGVRELERKIGEICRKAAREILQMKKESVRVNCSNLKHYLGTEKYTFQKAGETDEVGIVRGLAWTSVGGDTLQIEVNVMPGDGSIELTGQLGDVMKESAMAGITYIRSISDQYELEEEYFKNHDIHIHIPEGAVPKDGPSAGITMATAVLSAIIGRKVRADVAMTGEITLRGRVLPIGGLKEKLLAARTAEIKTVLVPKENEKDMEEMTDEIIGEMNILFVEKMEEVLQAAFV